MKYDFLEELEKQIVEVLNSKDRVLISIVGSGGTGKSYFGKYIRNNGVGRFDKRAVLVIDDRIMSVDFLFFFRRKIKLYYNGVDELQPVLERLPKRKTVIFYINATPERRLTKVDILLKLSTDEETRRRRLRQRDGDNPEKLKRFINRDDVRDDKIKYSYLIEARV